MASSASDSSRVSLFRPVYDFIITWLIGAVYFLKETFSKHKKLTFLPSGRSKDVVVITGGNRGIGLEVTKTLLNCDMHVVMGCRRPEEGDKVISKWREAGNIKTGELDCLPLDMLSLNSVRQFATEIRRRGLQPRILICNAGIMFGPYLETDDGFESQLQINYLGHCLLIHLLLPLLNATGTKENKSRIVSLSSSAHKIGDLDLDDIHMRNYYHPYLAYGRAKLSQLIFSKELDERFAKENYNVQSISLHPGMVNTDLFQNVALTRMFPFLKKPFKSAAQGSDTVVYAALEPSLDQYYGLGVYLENSSPTTPGRLALNREVNNRLWNDTLSLLKIEKFF